VAEDKHIEGKIDKMAEDIAFLKGQWTAIPPAELVKLAQRVAASEARIYSISGIISLVIAGVFSFFFKGGHS
jgi:hypothetical protein